MGEKSKTSPKHNPSQPAHNHREPKQNPLSAYVKYSGLAFQMLAAIGLAVWAGMKLDAYLGLGFPVFLLSFTLLAIVANLILIIKSLPKE